MTKMCSTYANAAFLLLMFLFGETVLTAQDKIISLRGTEERVTEGVILGTTSDGSPRIRTADGVETTVRISEVHTIIKEEPAEMLTARQAFQNADYTKAIDLARSIAEQYSGLPVSWAVEAFGIVADSYLLQGDKENARNWYSRITQSFGQTQFKTIGEIGMARIALLENDTSAAELTVRNLIEQAKFTLRPNSAESQVFGNSFFLLAGIQEKKQLYSDALESYLRIPALYPENPTLVKQALEAASRLKSQHKVFVN